MSQMGVKCRHHLSSAECLLESQYQTSLTARVVAPPPHFAVLSVLEPLRKSEKLSAPQRAGAAKEAATSQRLDSKKLDVSREGSYFYHLNDGLIPGDAGMRHARSNTSGRRHQRSNAVCMSDVLRRVQGPAKVTPDEEPLTCASCAAH